MWADYIWRHDDVTSFPSQGKTTSTPKINNLIGRMRISVFHVLKVSSCRRQFEQATLNPSLSVLTSTRLLGVHLLPSSLISYNLNKMANRKILTILRKCLFSNHDMTFSWVLPTLLVGKTPSKIFVSDNFRV